MGFWSRLFGKKESDSAAPGGPEHAVIVRFGPIRSKLEDYRELEDRIEAAITAARAGVFDGDEFALDGTHGHFYLYGPDADALFEVVRPLLAESELMRGATARLRYGPPEDGVREIVREVAQ